MKYLSIILISVIFTGCTITNESLTVCKDKPVEIKTVTKEKEVIKYVDKIVETKAKVPNYLLNDISIPKPPDRGLYIKSDIKHRNTLLTIYTIELLNTIDAFKLKIKNIKEWNMEN